MTAVVLRFVKLLFMYCKSLILSLFSHGFATAKICAHLQETWRYIFFLVNRFQGYTTLGVIQTPGYFKVVVMFNILLYAFMCSGPGRVVSFQIFSNVYIFKRLLCTLVLCPGYYKSSCYCRCLRYTTSRRMIWWLKIFSSWILTLGSLSGWDNWLTPRENCKP